MMEVFLRNMVPCVLEVIFFGQLLPLCTCDYFIEVMMQLFWYSKDVPFMMVQGLSGSYVEILGGKKLIHITVWFINQQ